MGRGERERRSGVKNMLREPNLQGESKPVAELPIHHDVPDVAIDRLDDESQDPESAQNIIVFLVNPAWCGESWRRERAKVLLL